MKKIIVTLTVLMIGVFLFTNSANAQMMRNSQPSITPSAQDLKDIQTGQDLYTKFQNKQLSCNQLKDSDFEKIGEYLMNRSFGDNTSAHIQMNNTMKQMMGENGEEQMHIRLGENATGCSTNAQGGVRNMMGWNYGSMMSGSWGIFAVFGSIVWVVLVFDLILAGIWLWKQINKKK